MKLIELSQIYQNMLQLIDDEKVTQEELKLAFNQIDEEIEEKAQNIAFMLKEIDSDIEKFKKIEEEFAIKRKRLESRKSNLKQYLEDNMKAVDKKKFKTEYFSFNIQKNAPSLNVATENYIPNEYYITERKLDRKKLLDAIKNGLEIKDVSLKQSESLRIR
ncbi:bacteriophage resistance factor, PF05565 family [Peptoanaerobacter stomatis]|uniref:Bacteriophage resistance factor, PF05565 family n=1 Tax=Peptoanaerobacter stomatis TaxID=796937 RepID=J6HBK0_9FIRM|nr:siphovirus Gp157 family protein [Peptoanaerobacter stomatis]EJU22510.1 bacteriophage resistance factor, PF05565 family [Peptoanaerobacter stomatis]